MLAEFLTALFPGFRHESCVSLSVSSFAMASERPVNEIDKGQSDSRSDELTPKDIANLYSKLQQAIDRVPATSQDEIIKHSPSVLPITPSTSTPTRSDSMPLPYDGIVPEEEQGRRAMDCPCRHIIKPSSDDMSRCALCEQVIPSVDQLLKDRDRQSQQLRSLYEELQQEHGKVVRYDGRIKDLEKENKALEEKVENYAHQIESLRHDLRILNDKYVDEIDRVSEIQHAKAMVENELEELSRRLFEEANGMVANEKREKHNLQVANRQLQERLREMEERLAAEQMQLKELREKMEEEEERERRQHRRASSTATATTTTSSSTAAASTTKPGVVLDERNRFDIAAGLYLAELFSEKLQITMAAHAPPAGMDDMVLDNFKEFVKLCPTLPLGKLHTLSFMKHCQTEDVEPCLRFGPRSRMSAHKLVEAIMSNKCFIEDAPPGYAEEQVRKKYEQENSTLKISALKLSSLWDRFSNTADDNLPFSGCQACGRYDPRTPLPYRFRISYFDDWACIDRYCRDRLVAVCEFYMFIRNLRHGYYNRRSLHDLYHETIRLRLQMFYAR